MDIDPNDIPGYAEGVIRAQEPTRPERIWRTPSGMLTRADWEAMVDAPCTVLPVWRRDPIECERRFLAWAAAEADWRAAQNEASRRPCISQDLDWHLQNLADAYRADADWARAMLAGRPIEAALAAVAAAE